MGNGHDDGQMHTEYACTYHDSSFPSGGDFSGSA
jgi:hypothetical protein